MGRLSVFSRMIARTLLLLLVTVWSAPVLAADPTGYTIGLSPGARSRGLAEAVTAADGSGSDALFYNPALMARSHLHLGVAGALATADRDSTKLAEAAQRDGDDTDPLATVVGKLTSERPTYAGTNIRLLDVITPFGGFMGFGGASLYSQHDEDLGRHTAQLNADAGAIAGVAAKLGPLSIGYSHYWLNRAGFGLDVDSTTRDAVVAATESGPLTPGQFPYSSFSTAQFGGATGGNAGMIVRPFKDNISQIGVAMLNTGGVKFSDKSAYGNQSTANELSGALHEQADLYGIPMTKPDDLPEMINVGMQLGFGTEDDGGKSTTWHLAMLTDYDDVAGHSVEHKFAVGAAAGISLSDKLALATGVPVMPLSEEYKEAYLHVGLKSIEVYSGFRPEEYATGGVRLQLHIGVSNRIAPLYLEIEAYSLTADPDGSYISTMGVSAALVGALLF